MTTLTQEIANLVAASNGLTQQVVNKLGEYDSRVENKEGQVDQFIADGKNTFKASISQLGIIESGDGVTSVRLPQLTAGEDGAIVNIADRWSSGHWGNSPHCLIHAYETYYRGGYALYDWNGTSITLIHQTLGANHPTFTITDHGQQTVDGNRGQPTRRLSLNMVLSRYKQGFCVIQTFGNTRMYGNDEQNTTDASFGNAGAALVFKTITNAELRGN